MGDAITPERIQELREMIRAGVSYRLSTSIHGENRWPEDTAALWSAMIDALIARLEAAPCGNRSLDADFYEALGYQVKREYTGKGRVFVYRSGQYWYAMQPATTSLDAITALVGEKLPDH